jgi:uroporphyrinogen III methyltransferase/synthase
VNAKSNNSPLLPPTTAAFVGIGPGDAGLVTARAAQVLARAEVVLFAQQGLIDPVVFADLVDELVPVDADRIDLSTATPSEAGRQMARYARDGRVVVRLYPGDPLIDGGATEHVAAFSRHGVPFEIVAAVPVSAAVPAYAGVALHSAKVRHTHVIDVANGGRVNFAGVEDPSVSVVLVGLNGDLPQVVDGLVKAGRTETTPISLTTNGATTRELTLQSTLADVVADVKAAKLVGPFVGVVSDTVALRTKLGWYETKPMFGWRVLVPRTKEQAGPMLRLFSEYGAVPEEVPTISVEAPRNPQQLDRALTGMVTGRYEWVAFTSVNAVRAVREKFEEYGLDARAFAGLKVAAVGRKTAEAIAGWGIKADLVPSGEESARGLLAEWPPYDDLLDPINRVFLPRADIATETLVAGLVDLGWEVDDITAYRTVRAAPPPAPVREAIKSGKFDAVAFTSSSTVRNLVGIAGKPHPSTVVGCIGPATAEAATELGLRVDVVAPEPSIEKLAHALAGFAADRRDQLTEAGEPITKPSDRRSGARRKA